jgi:hypothetical protein
MRPEQVVVGDALADRGELRRALDRHQESRVGAGQVVARRILAGDLLV